MFASTLSRRTTQVAFAATLVAGALVGPAIAWAHAASNSVTWTPLDEPGVGGRVTAVSISPWNATTELVGGDMLGVAQTTNDGASWGAGTGLPSYEMGAFTWDPTNKNVVWAGSMSGPVESTNGGATWTSMRNGMPAESADTYTAAVQKILIDPANDQHLIAVGGSQRLWSSPENPDFGVTWESFNGGTSWTQVSTLAGNPNILDAEWTGVPGQLIAVVDTEGLYESSDFGHTWTEVGGTTINSLDPQSIAISPSNPDEWWVGTSHGAASSSAAGVIMLTTNGGLSWTNDSTGLLEHDDPSDSYRSSYTSIVIAPSNPQIMYAAQPGFWGGDVFGSTNGGQSWTALVTSSNAPTLPYGSGPSPSALAVDPNNADHVMLGGWESMLETHDGGQTWTDISSSASSSGGFVGHGYSGIVAQDVVFGPAGSNTIALAGMDGSNPIVTHNGGTSWTLPVHSAYDSWDGAYEVSWGTNGHVYALLGQAGMFNGIASSANNGTTWTVAVGTSTGLPAQYAYFSTSPQGIAVLNDGVVLATIGGAIYRSTTNGASWTVVQSAGSYGDLAVSANGTTAYVSSANGTYSTPDGITLTSLGGPGFAPGDGTLTADPTSNTTLYVDGWRTSGGGLWRDSDGTWTQINTNTNVYKVAVDPTDTQRLLAVISDNPYHDVSNGGVLLSTNDGTSWTNVTGALPVTRASAVAWDPSNPGHAVIGTYGRGFWQAQFGAATAPAPAPTVSASPTVSAAPTVSATPTATPTSAAPTVSVTPTATPTSAAPTVSVTPTATPTSAAPTVSVTPTATPTSAAPTVSASPTTSPTATILPTTVGSVLPSLPVGYVDGGGRTVYRLVRYTIDIGSAWAEVRSAAISEDA